MNERPPRILFACGGTGGHVYPAVAIADAVREIVPTAVITFAGTRHRMEWEAVPKAGYSIQPISVIGLRRSLSVTNIRFPFVLMKGFWESWQLVDDFDADVAVGTGGFVAGPVLLAAHLRGRPTLVQEQNAYAGLTNRLLGRWADHVHGAFEEAAAYFPSADFFLTGNPTRRELLGVDSGTGRKQFGIPGDASVLFVFGGSGGSLALNRAVARHAEDLLRDDKLHILWQTGQKYYDEMTGKMPDHPRLQVTAYVDHMAEAYAASDLVVSRAGAITCSELMVTATPALLVPSPNVAGNHQMVNARAMVEQGAAELLEEPDLERTFTMRVRELMDGEERRREMAADARRLGRPDAAREIARDVLALAERRRSGGGDAGGSDTTSQVTDHSKAPVV